MNINDQLSLFWPAAVAACMEFHCTLGLGYVGPDCPLEMPTDIRQVLRSGVACWVTGIVDSRLWHEEFSLRCQSSNIRCHYFRDGALLLLDVEKLGITMPEPPEQPHIGWVPKVIQS